MRATFSLLLMWPFYLLILLRLSLLGGLPCSNYPLLIPLLLSLFPYPLGSDPEATPLKALSSRPLWPITPKTSSMTPLTLAHGIPFVNHASLTSLNNTLTFILKTSFRNSSGRNGMIYLHGRRILIQNLPHPFLQTVTKLQDFYSNPYIYMPFRLPTLDEKARDSELTDLIETTKQEANPPLRTLHNIIGNCFKPSAVLAALGGTHSIQNFVNGSSTPHQWAPSSPSKVNQDFTVLRTAVVQDIASQPTLHPYLAEQWFPKTVPKLDSDDFWHKAIHMQTPLVFTSPAVAQPPLPSASNRVLPFPLSAQVQTYVQQFGTLHDLLILAPFHTYNLDRILSPGLPPLMP